MAGHQYPVQGVNAGGEQVEAPIYNIDLATARYKSRAPSDLIEKAAQWLIEAENPVFVVGSQVGVVLSSFFFKNESSYSLERFRAF